MHTRARAHTHAHTLSHTYTDTHTRACTYAQETNIICPKYMHRSQKDMEIRRGKQEDLTDRQQGLIGYLILIQSASKLGQMDCLLAGRLTASEALACDATPARPLDIRVHQSYFSYQLIRPILRSCGLLRHRQNAVHPHCCVHVHETHSVRMTNGINSRCRPPTVM